MEERKLSTVGIYVFVCSYIHALLFIQSFLLLRSIAFLIPMSVPTHSKTSFSSPSGQQEEPST